MLAAKRRNPLRYRIWAIWQNQMPCSMTSCARSTVSSTFAGCPISNNVAAAPVITCTLAAIMLVLFVRQQLMHGTIVCHQLDLHHAPPNLCIWLHASAGAVR